MFAICNETFLDLNWSQEKIFQYVADCGYDGIEIAPFTINSDITKITAAEADKLRRAADRAGIKICGFHWILTKTEGLLLTSDDSEIRSRTAAYLSALARFCRDLGGDVMIFGSPNQRNRPAQMSMVEGYQNATDTLHEVLPVLEQTGITIAMEPLASYETNFLLNAEEALRLSDMVGSEHVKMMLDCKAMWAMEHEPIPNVIRRHKDHFVHFHANDPNLLGPGFGNLDFVPIFSELDKIGYEGWISVEVFDYTPGPERIARESLSYMRACQAQARSS